MQLVMRLLSTATLTSLGIALSGVVLKSLQLVQAGGTSAVIFLLLLVIAFIWSE